MTDREQAMQLHPAGSGFLCPHVCCLYPTDEQHSHLFEPSDCTDCRAVDEIRQGG